ncbi:MAG: permease prefix domain 1-containing protein, partial [Pseudomonadota bacterium]
MKLLGKIRALFHRGKLDAEMAEEMRAHVELQTQANLAAGMAPDEA